MEPTAIERIAALEKRVAELERQLEMPPSMSAREFAESLRAVLRRPHVEYRFELTPPMFGPGGIPVGE